jgi:hypothetical protein
MEDEAFIRDDDEVALPEDDDLDVDGEEEGVVLPAGKKKKDLIDPDTESLDDLEDEEEDELDLDEDEYDDVDDQ